MLVRTAIVTLFLCLLVSVNAHSQTVVMHIDRGTDSLISEVGPNAKRFYQFLAHGAFVLGKDDVGAGIQFETSFESGLGIRAKRKLNKVFAFGWELNYNHRRFYLDQKSGKQFPDTILHDKAFLSFDALRPGIYFRINMDPSRANHLGYFIDLGTQLEWNFLTRYVTKDELADGSFSKDMIRKLPYTNKLAGSAVGRIGVRRLAGYVSWRYTDLLKGQHSNRTIPPLTAGIEFGFN